MANIILTTLLSLIGFLGIALIKLIQRLYIKIEELQIRIHELTIEIERLKK